MLTVILLNRLLWKEGRVKLTDCLIIGYNDGNFNEHVDLLKAMGVDHPDYRDLNMNFIEHENRAYRALDILNYFYFQNTEGEYERFHNAYFLSYAILYLGTYLSRRGFTFDYLNLFQTEKEKLAEKLKKGNISTIAITTTVYTMSEPVSEIISFIRNYNNSVKIIVGGPFISKQVENIEKNSLELFCKYLNADFYIFNIEGEQALSNVLSAIKNGEDYKNIKNIGYRDGDNYVITPFENEINSLEENMVDYSLFPKEDIGEFLHIRLSKGCPYACSYCAFPLRADKYKYLDIEYAKKELDAVRNIGTVKRLLFIDDSFNVPKARFKELLKMMIEQKYDFKWHCFIRCDQCDEEMVELMKEANCEGVFVGLESANDKLLQGMNKTSRKEDFRRTIPLFKKAGFTVFISIFTGFPGETYDTFQETIDFLKEVKPDFYRPQLWYCDPVTPIWHQRDKYGLNGVNFAWSHDTMDVKTACDLNEWAFLSLDNPVWVPDPGFNYISIYYLKNRGMTIEHEKKFLSSFNAIVKEKLIYPNKEVASPELIEALSRACRYNSSCEADTKVVDNYSGKMYLQTEKYVFKEFFNINEEEHSNDKMYVALTSESKVENKQSAVWYQEKMKLTELESKFDNDIKNIVLATFNMVFSYLNNKKGLHILTGLDTSEVIPLNIELSDKGNIKELIRCTEQKVNKTKEHRTFALHVLTSSRGYIDEGLRFDIAYLFSDDSSQPMHLEKYHSRITNDLNLILKITNHSNDLYKIQMDYSVDKYSFEDIENLYTCLDNLLEDMRSGVVYDMESIKFNSEKLISKSVNDFELTNFNF